MADWEQLRELSHHVALPDYASLERTARDRRRRAAVVGSSLATLVLVAGGIGIGTIGDTDDPVQPAEDPTRTVDGEPQQARPLPEGATGVDLGPGRYRVPLDDTLAFDIDLPTATTAHDDGLFLSTETSIIKTEIAGEQYGVPRDPCTDHTIEPTGPTVDDLVTALTQLPAYQVSPPRAITLGGAEGVYLDARIPRTYDDSPCDDDTIKLPSNPDTAVGGPSPYRGRWWILEVHGHRVVIQQNCWECTKREFDAGPQITQTITFVSTG